MTGLEPQIKLLASSCPLEYEFEVFGWDGSETEGIISFVAIACCTRNGAQGNCFIHVQNFNHHLFPFTDGLLNSFRNFVGYV